MCPKLSICACEFGPCLFLNFRKWNFYNFLSEFITWFLFQTLVTVDRSGTEIIIVVVFSFLFFGSAPIECIRIQLYEKKKIDYQSMDLANFRKSSEWNIFPQYLLFFFRSIHKYAYFYVCMHMYIPLKVKYWTKFNIYNIKLTLLWIYTYCAGTFSC